MARHTTNAAKGRTTKAQRTGGGSAAAGAMRLSSATAAATAMEFAVPVAPGVLKTLSARQATVKNLVDRFGKLIARTQKAARPAASPS